MPIHDLIREGKIEEIKKLLDESPAEITSGEDEIQATPLQVAVSMGSETIVRLLVETYHAPIEQTNLVKHTPFLYAVYDNNSAMMRLLAKLGAKVDARDGSDCSGLLRAIMLNDYELAQLLLTLGAYSQDVFLLGKMLLHKVNERNLGINWCRLLLKYGAGLNFKFDSINLSDELLKQITAGQVIIGATKSGKIIDDNNDLFKHAIVNFDQLKTAIDKGVEFEFKALIRTTKKLIALNTDNLLLKEQLVELKNLKKYQQRKKHTLIKLSVEALLKKNIFIGPEAVPRDVLERIDERKVELSEKAKSKAKKSVGNS